MIEPFVAMSSVTFSFSAFSRRMIPVGSRRLILFGGLLSALALQGADLSFSGNSLKVLEVDAEASTGLEKIYVAYNLNNVSISFDSPSEVKFYSFSNLGGGFAEELPGVVHQGNTWTLPQVSGDMGYIVESEGRQYPFWIVDYSAHRLKLRGIAPSPTVDCDATLLNVDGDGAAIHYFTILGQQRTLSREIEVDYHTLEWDEQSRQFNQISSTATFDYLSPEMRITPPAYCATTFGMTGDRFLKAWNWEEMVETSTVAPTAVDQRTAATTLSATDESGKSNVIKGEDNGEMLGGSAPVEINFSAWVTDGVAHSEWQMSRDPNFENPELRYTQQDLDYNFVEEGVFYLRFVASNSDGSCESISDIYTVSIGASDLRIPNAFSPNGDGVNDEWKVAYRSLLSFECWIFDRYGNQITHLTAPDQGWDGKRGGKLVAPGVYYYVIQATGADGKKYKKSGDINILRSETTGQSSNTGNM